MGSPISSSTTAATATDNAPQAQMLSVGLGERSYPILIGANLIDSTELLARHVPYRDVLLVTNTVVAPLYAQRVETALARALPGRRVVRAVLPDGEQHKSLASAGRLFDVLIGNRFGRDAAVLALGGGVVGDLAGFVAACYQRGIDLVQVPTTLLAHVDSSVGGKTAVNHPGGKNLIGAFHQPRAVIADTQLLASLPPRELSAGLAEVIKYGLICDVAFFEWLESHIEALRALDPSALAHAIHRSCEIKAAVVGRDEREQGERALLNLGHTFGHAVESATSYREWLHGEAVGAGLVMAAAMSATCGLLRDAEAERVRRLIERTGLPSRIDSVTASAALDHMKMDKKVLGGRLRLVLLRDIGEACVTADYPPDALTRTLAA